jgi:hypothetical protein
LARATASTVFRAARCAGPTLTISAQSGSAMAESRASSPSWFMPISTTALRCSEVSRSSVSGTPTSLFRFPSVLREAPPAARMAPIISLVVVLPFEPVTAPTGIAKRRRW